MRRTLVVSLATVAGLLAGGTSMLAVQPAAIEPIEPPRDDLVPAGPAPREPVAGPALVDDDLLLVWSAGGLAEGLADEVAALPGVRRVTTVAGDLVDLVGSHAADGTTIDDLDDGWAIPLDVLAIEPRTYAGFLPKGDQAAVGALTADEVLLGSTSASLRGLRPGDTMSFASGRELTVSGVVDDSLIGGAEAVVARGAAAGIGVDTDRFLLVTHAGERSALEQAIRQRTDVELRVRAPGETPYLRHGDAVLPQAHIKLEFGEFAYRRSARGTAVEQDPAWVDEHLVDLDLPLVGPARCHRSIAAQLEGALTDLVDRGLEHLVDPAQYAGCHVARLIAPDAGVSRHAWGIAVDLNADDNPHGEPSVQDRRLVDTFSDWGFTWGGFWLVPDAMHFEYVGGPDISVAKVGGEAVSGRD